ncbi:MAG: hypothetical protein C4527_17870 [Candidatus Omnitrophota bacterium]|jgi:hypothetical protein|nr:MAG: hypothetical protein C4527_17870 [Candidatus Omnitrophota bacterium]
MDIKTVLIVLLFLLFLGCLSVVGYLFLQLESQQPQYTLPVLPTPAIQNTPQSWEPQQTGVSVFYLTKDYTQLETEKRVIAHTDSLTERIHLALKELLRKPISSNLINPIPEGAQVENVFWSEAEGRVYLNFTEQLLSDTAGHALHEWAMIYAIVNTTAELSPRIKDVQILVNGEIIQNSHTVWDWSLPFAPDKTFVRYTISTDF